MIEVALFGIHKLLLTSLLELEKKNLFPKLVVFPASHSIFHNAAALYCIKHGIPFLRPHSVNTEEFLAEIKTKVFNRIVVTGYDQIFSQNLLSLGTLGVINCHGGLLPEERGPIPYKWAIYNGKSFTGVTYHQMTERVDEGNIYIKNIIAITKRDTNETLFNKICKDISKTVPLFFSELDLEKLFKPEYSTTSAIKKYQGQIPAHLTEFDLSLPAEELSRRVRAFSPRPGVFLKMDDGKRMLVKATKTYLKVINGYPVFRVKDGSIIITDYEIFNTENHS